MATKPLRAALLAALAVTSTPGQAEPAPQGPARQQPAPEPKGQTVEAGVLKDLDYRFQLSAGREGEEILQQGELTAAASDFQAAIRWPGGDHMMVLCEFIQAGMALGDYLDFVVEQISGLVLERGERRRVEIAGRQGLQLPLIVDTGARVGAVVTVIERDGWVYRLMCTHLGGHVPEQRLPDMLARFRLLPGTPQPRPDTTRVEDRTGTDWTIANGRWIGLAGPEPLVVEPHPAFARLVTGMELLSMGYARVGMASRVGEIYATVSWLPCVPEQRETQLQILRGEPAADAEPFTLEILGQQRPGVTYTMDLGAYRPRFFECDWITPAGIGVLSIWTTGGSVRDSATAVQRMAQAIRKPEPTDWSLLTGRLRTEANPMTWLGETEVVRAGCFVDFAPGVVWRAPEPGNWRMFAGPGIAMAEERDCALFAHDMSRGITLRIRYDDPRQYEDGEADSADRYHDMTTAWYADGLGQQKPLDRPVSGDAGVRGTRIDFPDDPIPYTVYVGTLWREGFAADIVVEGNTADMDRNRRLVKACLAALELRTGLQALEQTDTLLLDRRVGLRLDLRPGDRLRRLRNDEAGKLASTWRLDTEEDGTMEVAGIWTLAGEGTYELLRGKVARKAANDFRKVRWGEATRLPGQWQCLLARTPRRPPTEFHFTYRGGIAWMLQFTGEGDGMDRLAARFGMVLDPLGD